MRIQQRMLLISGLVALGLTSCKLKKTYAELKDGHFETDTAYGKSIGLLLHRGTAETAAVGGGFIIGETSDQYVGLTTRSVLDKCMALTPANESSCWIRFQAGENKFKFAEVSHYSTQGKKSIDWKEIFPDSSQSLALFGINKRRAAHLLTPLELSYAFAGDYPASSLVAGLALPTGFDDANIDSLRLIKNSGHSWQVAKDSPVMKTTHVFQSSLEGAPLFAYEPSGEDYRMVWRVVGVVQASDRFPLIALSIKELERVKKLHPELVIWSKLQVNEKLAPPQAPLWEGLSVILKKSHEDYSFQLNISSGTYNWDRLTFDGTPVSRKADFEARQKDNGWEVSWRIPKEDVEGAAAKKVFYLEYPAAMDSLLLGMCRRETEALELNCKAI